MTALLILIAIVAMAVFWSREGAYGLKDYSQSRKAIDAILSRLENELKENSGNAPALIANRQKLCRNLGVDELALRIYDEIKFYSTCILTDPTSICPAVRNPKSKEEYCTWEAFTFDLKDCSYGMEFKERKITCLCGIFADHAHLKLFEIRDRKEHLILEISAVKEGPHPEFGEFHPFAIDAFIPGRWITDFFELRDQIRLHNEKHKLEGGHDPVKLAEQKRKFGL